jgi:uncharacterized protein (DUF2336 family)
MPPSVANAGDRQGGPASGHAAGIKSHKSLIDELEAAVANRNISSRADILRRVTDLFVTGSDRFDEAQRALFDDVMTRLVEEIDKSARAAFGERLVGIADAPARVSSTLALDDSIEVAGPLLTHSEQLDDETLIAGAKTKSQAHLLAISRRKTLSEGITDVLVERGDQQVVISTAANSGARFSEAGYSTLVTRSKADDELALKIWVRAEIPREHLLALFAAASDAVRVRLEAADRGRAALVRDMVKQASDQIQKRARDRSAEFAAAQTQVENLHRMGTLTESQLRQFAEADKFNETTVALSLLADLPIGAVERALVHDHSDQVLLLAKAMDLSWQTTKAILLIQAAAGRGSSAVDIERCFATFNKLKPDTAKTAIKFYRLREQAANPSLK